MQNLNLHQWQYLPKMYQLINQVVLVYPDGMEEAHNDREVFTDLKVIFTVVEDFIDEGFRRGLMVPVFSFNT